MRIDEDSKGAGYALGRCTSCRGRRAAAIPRG